MNLLSKLNLQTRAGSEFPFLAVKETCIATVIDWTFLGAFAKFLKLPVSLNGVKFSKVLLGKTATTQLLITMSDGSPIAYAVTRGGCLQELQMIPAHLAASKTLLSNAIDEVPGTSLHAYRNPRFLNSAAQSEKVLKSLEALWNAMMSSPHLPEVISFEHGESETAEYLWRVDASQRLHWSSRKAIVRAERIIREINAELQDGNWILSNWIHKSTACTPVFNRSAKVVSMFSTSE